MTAFKFKDGHVLNQMTPCLSYDFLMFGLGNGDNTDKKYNKV